MPQARVHLEEHLVRQHPFGWGSEGLGHKPDRCGVLGAILIGGIEEDVGVEALHLFPRIASTRWADLVVETVEYVPQAIGTHEHTATVKRREPRRLFRGKRRHLLQQAIHRPPHEFAHGTVLLPRDSPQPLHDRIWKKNLNLLHGYML
jgi:hypothetical protein